MMEITGERPVTMAEAREALGKIEGRDKEKELNFRAKKAKEYFKSFANAKKGDAGKLKKALLGLKISRLKDRHIAKIIDVMPEDMDSLKVLLSGETISPKADDLKRILEVARSGK